MRAHRPTLIRRVAAGSAGLLLAVLAASGAGPRPVAATPHPDTIDLAELSMVPERTWGVSGQNPAATQTPTLESLVWDFAQSGNRMFVGGAFLSVQQDQDATPIAQPFVAAFDVETGDWISSWTPQLDRAVYTLDVLPNGSLLVGGEFETVNGQGRRGLVAIDPLTGAVDPAFAGSVDRPWSTLRAVVRDVKVDGDLVYAAGNFSHLDGLGGSRARVYKAGRFDLEGAIDTGWLPLVTGSGVWGLDTDPSRNEVHLSGFFSAVNGEPDTGYFHTVDATTGASVAGKIELPRNQPGVQPEIFDVVYGDDVVFTIGEQHIVQVLDASDHDMIGFHHTGIGFDGFGAQNFFGGGAYQVGERIGDVVFAGCHCTYSTRFGYDGHYSSIDGERTPHRLVMAYDAATGELLDDFMPDIHSPKDGTWAIGSDTNGCLYLGGDFHVGGVDSGQARWLGGFARFCGDGPRVDGVLVPKGSPWRYDDSGADLGSAWRSVGFDDAGWAVGSAELGFGDGDEATILGAGHVTYYARMDFELAGSVPDALDMRLKADDGAIVYLNGVEVLRDNMPDGPVTAATPASGWRSGTEEGFGQHTVSAASLVEGTNTLAVEVHNVWAGNSDLSIDVELGTSSEVVGPPPARLIEVGSSWHHTDSTDGAPTGWPIALTGEPQAEAELGFGDGDEATTLAGGRETYYFSHDFEVTGAAQITDLVLTLLIDDGAVVYLNGTELTRVNMPGGPIDWDTRPTDWIGNADEVFVDHPVSGAALVDGTNTLAVEVHNYWPGNPDLSFDLALAEAG